MMEIMSDRHGNMHQGHLHVETLTLETGVGPSPFGGLFMQEAIKDCDAVLILDPRSDEAFWIRGDAKRVLGDYRVRDM